ncbi:hypothetical protein CSIM01_02460 [Colletotrichum simmondsii]|uniref:Uncharacterized protein n=1 Tax=Colletotrichum simmondsii TaxID=703756 RepID=A0A135S7L8_9PEZI|nr:hypothetical protein CSIM01_02460 [Colletotrichum simmondsii]
MGRIQTAWDGADDDDVGVDEGGGLGFNGCAKTGALQEQSGCRSWQSLIASWLWTAFGAGRVVANGLAEEKEKVEFRIQDDGVVFRDGFLVIVLPVQSELLPSIRAVSLPLRRVWLWVSVGARGSWSSGSKESVFPQSALSNVVARRSFSCKIPQKH